MRFAGLLILALFTSLLSDAFAQGVHVTLRAQEDPYDGYQSYAGVWGDGNFAYIGSERRTGILIYDITSPSAPVLASYYAPPNSLDMEDIKVANGIAYFASNLGGGLHIVDVSNPAAPVLLSQISSSNGGYDNTHKVAVWQNFVFIPQNLSSPAVIKVFDVTDPSNPVLKTSFTATDPSWVNDLDIQTNTAGSTLLYTAGWGGKGDIWDITSIATQAPVLLGSFSPGSSGSSVSATADGSYLAYSRKTTDGTSQVKIFNVSNPASITLASTITMSAFGIDAIAPHDPKIMGNLLYVSWFQAGMLVFDITNPAQPVLVGSYDTYPGSVDPAQLDGDWGVYPYLGQDRVLLSDRNSGLYIVDATGASSTPALYNLHVNPTTVLGGSSSTGTVYLVGLGGSGGTVVTTTSDNSAAVPPANVTVNAGGTNANFTITTNSVSSATTANISASLSPANLSTPLTVSPTGDFLLAAAPISMTLPTGTNSTVNGRITAVAGYSSAVTFSCTGTPPPTCNFSPSSLTPSTSGTPFTLTIGSASTTNYSFNLTATGSDANTTTHQIPVTLNVANLTLSAPSPTTLTLFPGTSSTFATQLTATGSLNSTVALFCNDPATGVSCAFSPSSSVMPVSGTPIPVTTTVNTTTATPAGQYTVTMSADPFQAPITKTQNVTVKVIDFALGTPSPASASVSPGGTTQIMEQVSALGSFAGSVTLSCNAPATGVSCTFSPSATVSPTNGNPVNVTVTVATTSSTPGGQYNLVISANSAGAPAAKTQTVALSVASFALGSPSPSSVNLVPGASSMVTAQVTAMTGFSGSVTLSCNTPAPGVTCTFSPSATVSPTVSNPVTVTVTVASTSATLAGQYTLTVSASSNGAAPETQDIALSIMDFSLAATTNTQTVAAGQTATYPLTIAGVNGSFTNAVSLACSGAPAMSTCSVSPNSVTPGSSGVSATVTVTTTARKAAMLGSGSFSYALWLPFVGIVFVGQTSKRKLRHLLGIAILLMLTICLPGCGGGSSSNPPPPPPTGTTPGTYTLSVTGISGSLSRSVPLTLTVQ